MKHKERTLTSPSKNIDIKGKDENYKDNFKAFSLHTNAKRKAVAKVFVLHGKAITDYHKLPNKYPGRPFQNKTFWLSAYLDWVFNRKHLLWKQENKKQYKESCK